MNIAQNLIDNLWQDYTALNPHTLAIHDLIAAKGKVSNDHIAIRTFNLPNVNIAALSKYFTNLGYVPADTYNFEQKKLDAQHFEHPDKSLPKVFISELRLQDFSQKLQNTVSNLINQVPKDAYDNWNFPCIGRPWSLNYTTYQELLAESEYAAWVAAFGFRANHFTVYVNDHPAFDDLKSLNDFIIAAGYPLNESGGIIKGSQKVFLEQSSTLAGKVDLKFDDQTQNIPACYYEFAQRFPLPNGQIFQGFVTGSADKIFESTNTRQ